MNYHYLEENYSNFAKFVHKVRKYLVVGGTNSVTDSDVILP